MEWTGILFQVGQAGREGRRVEAGSHGPESGNTGHREKDQVPSPSCIEHVPDFKSRVGSHIGPQFRPSQWSPSSKRMLEMKRTPNEE